MSKPRHPRAQMLREMLEQLDEHRRTRAASMPTMKLIALDASEFVIDNVPPRWRSHIQHAQKDPIAAALYAVIREEGWRAYAEGGLEAMQQLCDEAVGDNGRLTSILDHRWDNIGVGILDNKGVWIA